MNTKYCTTAFFVLLVSLTAIGCKEKREFPPVKDVATLKSTVVLPTLEHPLPKGKNAVYAASLLFAWDELRRLLGGNIIVGNDLKDLSLLNKSKSHRGALAEDDVSKSAEVNGDMVKVAARFEQSLPFEVAFQRFPRKLKFSGSEVVAFGLWELPDMAIHSLEILYYKNDGHFAIKLIPRDTAHEILLFTKPGIGSSNLSNCFVQLEVERQKDKQEILDNSKAWRYYINNGDELAVPLVQFNIETYFPEMARLEFSARDRQYSVESIYQRTAFLLDEKGAEVESEAYVASTDAGDMEEETPKPKHLLFNKPFFIALKKKGSDWPYFAAYIENAELLQTD